MYLNVPLLELMLRPDGISLTASPKSVNLTTPDLSSRQQGRRQQSHIALCTSHVEGLVALWS